jgi:HAD superfamily hydrolase (TIGR01490 family)
VSQVLAVFDLDYTLIEADCEIRWSDYLHDLGIVDEAFMHKIHRFDLDYIEGHLDYHEFDRTLLSPLYPINKVTCDMLLKDYLPRLQPHIRPWMMDVVSEHHRAGHRVVLATASNSYLAEAIAKILGFTDLVCTTIKMQDGKPTGEIEGEPAFREGKVNKLQQWAQGKGISFEQSYAYSDSHNDIPLLSLVGHPVAVTPDPVMTIHARRNGWEIMHAPEGYTHSKWMTGNEAVAP